MTMKDRLAAPLSATQPRTITCPYYRPQAGSRRCEGYLDGGSCSRSDELMCTEWLKANGHFVPPTTEASMPVGTASVVLAAQSLPSSPPPASAAVPRDLFSRPLPPPPAAATKRAPTQAVEAGSTATPPPAVPVRCVTDAEIASFKDLGVEVCIRSDTVGDVWLVPEYTGQQRFELSVEHAECAERPDAG